MFMTVNRIPHQDDFNYMYIVSFKFKDLKKKKYYCLVCGNAVNFKINLKTIKNVGFRTIATYTLSTKTISNVNNV